MANSVDLFYERQKKNFQCKEDKVFFSIKNYPSEEYKCLIEEYSPEKISELKTQFDNILNISDPYLAYNIFVDILKTNFCTKICKNC